MSKIDLRKKNVWFHDRKSKKSDYSCVNPSTGETIWHTAACHDIAPEIWEAMLEIGEYPGWCGCLDFEGDSVFSLLIHSDNIRVIRTIAHFADNFCPWIKSCVVTSARYSTFSIFRFFFNL